MGHPRQRAAEAAEADPVPGSTDGVIDDHLARDLPSDEELLGHYAACGSRRPPPVRRRTARTRPAQRRRHPVLERLGVDWSAEMVIATVDGACVSALSEGRDVQQTARARLRPSCSARKSRPSGFRSRTWSPSAGWVLPGPVEQRLVHPVRLDRADPLGSSTSSRP